MFFVYNQSPFICYLQVPWICFKLYQLFTKHRNFGAVRIESICRWHTGQNVTKKLKLVFGLSRKHCGKRRKCWFQKAFFCRVVKTRDCSVMGVLLTHYQMTNFGLFQTERVCRQQFWIWWKWKKVLQKGRKHCGKRRNCSLWAISPFPTVFSNEFHCRQVKTRVCLGKG